MRICGMNDLLYSRMKYAFLIGLFVVSLFSISKGNDFRYLRTSEGLYDGEINSIAQDSTGNMWFATWSGLIRYDGYNFKIFRPELGDSTSIPDKKIKKLLVDSRDNLWIASSRHLSVFDKRKKTFRSINFEGMDNDLNILQINELDETLIIQTTNDFYSLPIKNLQNSDYQIKNIKVNENEGVSSHFFEYSVTLNNSFILVDNIDSVSWLCFSKLVETSTDTIISIQDKIQIDGYVNNLEYVSNEKLIYIATSNGVRIYSLNKQNLLDEVYFEGSDIEQLLYTSNHKLFGSTKGPELLCVDLHTGTTSNFISDPNELGSLLPNNIHCLYEDFSGNLWVGHQGQGLSIMNLFKKEFYSFKRDPLKENSLNSNTIMCFEGTEHEVFIGCRSGGLNIINKRELTFKRPGIKSLSLKNKNLPAAVGDGIWDITKQSDSLFWLGTDLGIFKLVKPNTEWEIKRFKGKPEINISVRKIFVDENNNLWCGTFNEGLIFISNIENNVQGINYRFPSNPNDSGTISDNTVHDIFLDSKNRFWIATLNGLNQLEGKYLNLDLSGKQKPNVKFKQYVAHEKTNNFLNNNEVNCIFENFDGKIWLATQGGGINILNPETGDFDYITKTDGLPSNDVQGILVDDDGKVWLSTLEGLVSYNRFLDTPDFTIFDTSDGIKGETFMVNSFYKCPDGQMFFGSDNGFTCFYPNEIAINEIQPKIAFSDFSFRATLINVGDTLANGYVLDQSINFTEKVVLPFNKNYFKIDVATLHYQDTEKNKYTYTLEEYMNGWATNLAHNEAIEFANLRQGNYILKVKGISSDNVLSSDVKILEIEIQPPWYKTWYMTSIFSILAVSLIMGIIYIIINRQRLIYQKKLDKIELENNESKMLFLTNIAHELRTPLSLVIAPIEDLMKNYPIDSLWKNHLQLIHRNSNYLLRLINQIIDFRKLNAGKLVLNSKRVDIVRVVKDVVLNFKGYETNRNVNLYLRVPSESVFGAIDVQKVEEVLYNLISNAFKHTFDNHSIIVSMDFPAKYNDEDRNEIERIRISVLNEGKEISEDNRAKIFERFFKVDESSDGAGIGLSFSKSLIELHNGKIEVESIPDKGVAFHIILPVAKIEVDENTFNESVKEPIFVKSLKSNSVESATIKISNKPTILVVEDNHELREFLYSYFSRNYYCLVAENGDEAMEIIENQNLSLIISDVIMPGTDGYELCEKVKSNLSTCQVPFVLLTAKNAEEQMIKGYEAGADGYISKPFDINLLSAQIDRLIKNRELIKEKYRTQNFMVEMEKNKGSKDELFIQNVRKILEDNISDPEFNVNKLSNELNISSTQLYRKLKELTGHSPVEFIRILKLQKACSMLGEQSNTVKEVCYLTGFNNLSYFIKCFREHFGVTPAYFRDNGVIEEKKQAV